MDPNYQKIETRTGEFLFCVIFLFKISAIIGFIISKKASKKYQRAITANDKVERDSLYSDAKRLDMIAGNWFTFDMILSYCLITLTGIGYLLINLTISMMN